MMSAIVAMSSSMNEYYGPHNATSVSLLSPFETFFVVSDGSELLFLPHFWFLNSLIICLVILVLRTLSARLARVVRLDKI
jgi:hypothetical protein